MNNNQQYLKALSDYASANPTATATPEYNNYLSYYTNMYNQSKNAYDSYTNLANQTLSAKNEAYQAQQNAQKYASQALQAQGLQGSGQAQSMQMAYQNAYQNALQNANQNRISREQDIASGLTEAQNQQQLTLAQNQYQTSQQNASNAQTIIDSVLNSGTSTVEEIDDVWNKYSQNLTPDQKYLMQMQYNNIREATNVANNIEELGLDPNNATYFDQKTFVNKIALDGEEGQQNAINEIMLSLKDGDLIRMKKDNVEGVPSGYYLYKNGYFYKVGKNYKAEGETYVIRKKGYEKEE
jgi:hypothetical protein